LYLCASPLDTIMQLLDGKLLSANIKAELAAEVEQMQRSGERPPHLVAVLVGENPASQVYVASKIRSCAEVGFKSTLIQRDANLSEAELLEIVAQLNDDPEVDGILVQLPLPRHIREENITLAIDHRKDVDGFHPVNIGRMTQGLAAYLPATPYGIMEMLRRYNVETAGKHCVVVGRSNIVGTPMSILLSRKGYPGDCTVTLTHSRTKNLAEEVRRADIIVAAIGIPEFVKGDWVKPGAVVIDVGINRIEDATRKSGQRLVGDVEFEAASKNCSYITPVPGGVGLMTVTALLMNTLKARKGEVY
jgi:methylenetetrahydrofolate dehydrogenase (NADP+) / methenyltetrahydrofolate cyclohydrolase